MKKTLQLYLVVIAIDQLLGNNPPAAVYSGKVSEATGLLAGTVGPILRSLVDEGFLTKQPEVGDRRVLKRALRAYYLPTPEWTDKKARLMAEMPGHIKTQAQTALRRR